MPSSIFSPFITVVALPLALCIILFCLKRSSRTPDNLPPGPRAFPIIGNLHLLSPLPHHDVAVLSKTYGPIMHLRLGSVPTIFISSPSLAEQVLKTHDLTFANRPYSSATEMLSYGFRDVAFSQYGPYWRVARKLFVGHFSNQAKIDSDEFIRREEIANFVKSLKDASKAQFTVDVSAKVRLLVADIVCRAVMGRKCMEESMDGTKFAEQIHEAMRLLGSFNLNDYIPALKILDLQGIRRRTESVKGQMDKFLEKIIDEHMRLRDEGKKFNDFIDNMLDSMSDEEYLELKLDRTSIKAITMNVFEGSLDTTPSAIEWAFVELLRHPKAMKKLRGELERVVGIHRAVDESDLSKLTYLDMIVKETLRLHQPTPFLLHHNKEETKLGRYTIPRGSSVMVCIWAMSRDPSIWPNADEFIPERFENNDIDVRGRDFRMLPFGSGRRSCPGMIFGLRLVPLVLAQLVHCFDWELPDGVSPSELDMTEKFGISLPRAVHLRATPAYRLAS